MGQARKASADRQKRGVQGRNPRRPDPAAAELPPQPPTVQTSRSERSDENDPSIRHPSLVQPNSPDQTARYRALRLKAELALEKLCDINSLAPPNVRASAARTLLELTGAIGPKAKDDRDQGLADSDLEPERMTLADIDREIRRLGEV